jgi:hypothetical protein
MIDNSDSPVAGPSRVDSYQNEFSSLLETPTAVFYPNVGDSGTKTKPQQLRRNQSGIVDCYGWVMVVI